MNKKLLMTMLAGMLSVPAFALNKSERSNLIEKLVRVESSGKANIIGDHGKAFGILQIHAEMVTDANRISHDRTYTHRDMFDPKKAREVAEIVLAHYDSHIEKQTGISASEKQLAFIWNGGGSSWKRCKNPLKDTKQINLEKYWSKVSSK